MTLPSSRSPAVRRDRACRDRAAGRTRPSPTASGSHGARQQLVLGQLPQLLHRAELLAAAAACGRARGRRRRRAPTRHLLAAQLAVVRDREAVRLVAHLLQQVQRLRVARDAHRLALAGQVHLLEPLGEARDADVFEAELLEHAHRDAELALAAVDERAGSAGTRTACPACAPSSRSRR